MQFFIPNIGKGGNDMSKRVKKAVVLTVLILLLAVCLLLQFDFAVSEEEAVATATAFFDAINYGNIDKVEALLHPQYELDEIEELKKTDSYRFLTYDKASLLGSSSGLGPQFKNGLWVHCISGGKAYIAFLRFKRNYRGYGIDLFVCFQDDSILPPGNKITQ